MKQKTALNILKSGRNVFLTGSAGAGKTYVLNQYIQYLRERNVPVAVTASTGIAATHMNGMTIHAWAGIGIKDQLNRSQLQNMRAKKYLKDKMEKAKVLIIDEISMLHKNQLDLVNEVLKFFKNTTAAFGGIQVIFSGDFFQLPPVGKAGETSRDKFAFMSKAWLDAKLSICYLTEQHRQEDNELNDILNEIRNGEISSTSYELLEGAKSNSLEEIEDPPKLYSHNRDVSLLNITRIRELEGISKLFQASTKGNPKLLEILKKSVRAEQTLELKKGAKVMFVKNNYEAGFINGTLGEVIGFSEGKLPIIKISTGEQLTVVEEEWAIEDDNGKALASYSQIPLRLAWAITIHKSQGMTLEAAEIDLSKSFEKGQGYVALSRLKSLKGLRLLGFNQTALEVDNLAFRANKRFLELSEEAENALKQINLEKEAIAFLERCGGLTNPLDIKKFKNRKKEKKQAKQPTIAITKEYVLKGMSIDEIAEERGLTAGTIIGHLVKVKASYPEVDISAYKPEATLFRKIQIAYKQILAEKDPEKVRPDGTVKSSALFEALNKEVSYADLKLAMAFM
jgi:ATP-dependent exoDNAse (exonuclease V) alpha subunit